MDTRSTTERWHEALLKAEGLIAGTTGLDEDKDFIGHMIAEGIADRPETDPLLIKALVNAPQFGSFIDGEGVFISEEDVDGIKWKCRGVWDRITSESCRWHQSASKDGGKNWDWNWWMEWARQGSSRTATE